MGHKSSDVPPDRAALRSRALPRAARVRHRGARRRRSCRRHERDPRRRGLLRIPPPRAGLPDGRPPRRVPPVVVSATDVRLRRSRRRPRPLGGSLPRAPEHHAGHGDERSRRPCRSPGAARPPARRRLASSSSLIPRPVVVGRPRLARAAGCASVQLEGCPMSARTPFPRSRARSCSCSPRVASRGRGPGRGVGRRRVGNGQRPERRAGRVRSRPRPSRRSQRHVVDHDRRSRPLSLRDPPAGRRERHRGAPGVQAGVAVDRPDRRRVARRTAHPGRDRRGRADLGGRGSGRSSRRPARRPGTP